ncbi:hypothetical protein A9Q95_09795 [Rhodobacterales bacterium 59_46_T64]|nr:hypothetical protein A9Q95_09795 [Rhodobacterales bacterium 59_46_T64]
MGRLDASPIHMQSGFDFRRAFLLSPNIPAGGKKLCCAGSAFGSLRRGYLLKIESAQIYDLVTMMRFVWFAVQAGTPMAVKVESAPLRFSCGSQRGAVFARNGLPSRGLG